LEPHHDEVPHSNSPSVARSIPDSTIATLRELFLRMLRAESQVIADGVARAGDDVRDALRNLCEDARRHSVRAEQLVIAIKQGWLALHNDRPRPRVAAPDEMLNHAITVCIDEYYSENESR
jgi:hypothetical protein